MEEGWTGYKRMLWTVALVFTVTFLGQVIGSATNVFEIDLSTLQQAVNAAILAVIALVINYLNPKVTQYGIGSQ